MFRHRGSLVIVIRLYCHANNDHACVINDPVCIIVAALYYCINKTRLYLFAALHSI
jgi:hypothetical protein